MKYYLNYFIFYSLIGFILETCVKIFLFEKTNNGILKGPWIPIYGIGACIVIFINSKLKKKKIKNKKISLFFISIIFLTILEFLTGYIIELTTGKVFWDFSGMIFNIGPYISLESSTIWGLFSLLIVYIINPKLDKKIKNISGKITTVFITLITIDFILTIVKM